MKKILFILAVMTSQITTAQSIYDFKLKGINGKTINLADYKGKNILIVNTASECGYTPQYEGLEKLYQQYKGKLVVIGVPANNFGGQEPGTNAEIATFCSKEYQITFPMAAKESVKGADIDPFFKWLIAQKNPDFTGDINWNFEKFLFNEKGELIHRYRSGTKPMSEEITSNLK
jgi:glutathione peroxidase